MGERSGLDSNGGCSARGSRVEAGVRTMARTRGHRRDPAGERYTSTLLHRPGTQKWETEPELGRGLSATGEESQGPGLGQGCLGSAFSSH